jgi:HEAT repeat protein
MSKPNFQNVLDALDDESTAFPNRYLPLFSDLSPKEISALMARWPDLALKRKHDLLARLVNLYAEDTRVSFDTLAAALLSDPDEQIRVNALRLLAESEDTHLLPALANLAENDPETEVRIRAVGLLGHFIELGELEEITEETQDFVEECLLRVARSENPETQRAAIEAISFASHPDIEALIQSAYTRREPRWVATALLAMGRSADPHWEELVLSKLSDANTDIRRNAVQAAGELRIELARKILLTLLEEEDDDEIFALAIWSLSQIGGEDVRITLETLLDQAEEEDVIEYLEEALENLDFTEEMNAFDLLAIDPDDELEKDD